MDVEDIVFCPKCGILLNKTTIGVAFLNLILANKLLYYTSVNLAPRIIEDVPINIQESKSLHHLYLLLILSVTSVRL